MSDVPQFDEIDFDFDTVREDAFVSVPPGTYLCRIEEARPGTTRVGDPRWAIKLVVDDGPETGRFAAWDGIVFSERGAPRAKQVLSALGLPHEGRVRLQPTDLIGKRAFVSIVHRDWIDPLTQRKSRQTSVPYDGIRPAEEAKNAREDRSDAHAEVPF